MSTKSPTALAIAAVLITLPLALIAQAPESQQTAKMVAAQASITSTIDSQKMPPGSQFRVRLDSKVRLQNGPELPAGTMLVGQVANDDTQSTAAAKLALRFTEADLKNGQTVPIKATIVDVYKMTAAADVNDYQTPPAPHDWNSAITTVDEAGIFSGVDFHSSIDSPNSGVFVSTRKDDIKLSSQLGLELAIAARNPQEANSGQ